jgi:hypothetical protein
MTALELAARCLGWLLSGLLGAAVSLLTARAWSTGRPAFDRMVQIFLWIFFTTLMTFLFGLAGQLGPGPLAAFAALGLAALLASPVLRGRLAEEVKSAAADVRTVSGLWRDLPAWIRRLTAIFLSAIAVRSVFLVWALPPFVWDSLTYHLTNVAHWVQSGRIALFETPVQRIYLPANYEVLAGWFTVFLHHDVLVEAAGLPAYVLAGAAMVAIGRSLGLPPAFAWVGSLAYLSTPALVFASTGTKNDPIMAGLYLFLMAVLLDVRKRWKDGEQIHLVEGGVLLALGFFLALGTKAYILHLSAGLAVLAVWPVDSGAGERGPRALLARLRSEWRALSPRARALLAALLAAGALLGGFWYVRNLSLTGSPFYPYEVRVGARVVVASGREPFQFDLQNVVNSLRVLGEKFGDKQARILPDLPGTTGWGWVVYGMGLAASAWAIVRRPGYRPVAAAFLVSLFMLMLSSKLTPWNMRYFLWFPAAACVGLAEFLSRVREWDLRLRQATTVLFGFCLIMNLPMTLNYNLFSVSDFQAMLALPAWERQSGTLHVRVPDEYESVYAFVPREEILGYNLHENGFVYPLFRADFSQRLVFVPFSSTDSCDSIAEAMESRGTRYLFVAPEHTPDLNIARLRECAAEGSAIRERAGGLYVVKRDG